MVSSHSPAMAGDMYTRTLGGLGTCYLAGLPFYRNDLLSTTIFGALAFGVPVLVQRIRQSRITDVAGAVVR